MTNQEIIQALDALNALADKEMPIELTYKVMDNISKLMKSYEPYLKSLDKVKEKYEEGSEMFFSETQKLLNLKIDIEINKFKKQELLDSGITLSPIQLIGLNPLIMEVEDG